MQARSSGPARHLRFGPWLVALGATAGCDGVQSALDPAGPGARRIAVLWWVMLGTAAVVSVVVLALLIYALFRRRSRASGDPLATRPERESPEADRRGTRLILIAGAGIPALILIGVFVLSVATLRANVTPRGRPDLAIEVVGRRWWWHIRYLDDTASNIFTTANEIRVPVGARVEIRLASDDVIHSFWVPALQGKLDLIPGRRNVTWIEASAPGIYRGQCAEYCGLQHARMAFMVVAMPPRAFDAWLTTQRRPAVEPQDDQARRGQAVFLSSGCALCHTIRGTPTGGVMGPDLTHLASRLTLAAGTLPNTLGHLGGWIGNPQALKPGALMPRVELPPTQSRALLHYLETLR